MPQPLHAISLFAGIGGFELALHHAGIPTVAAVEIDPTAAGVITDHYPHIELFPDIREVTAHDLRTAGFDPSRGIVTAGWPCQGNSIAGHRGGMDDPRTGLWTHVVRLLDNLRPAWFLGENVPGLLSIHQGRDFATIIGDLAQLGMGVSWRMLDAQHFGVPQRRRRVFIVGRAGDDRGPVQVLFEPDRRRRDPAPRRPPPPGTAPIAALGASDGGADDNDAQGGRLIIGPLQATGAGGRGHRIDAEGAATGHLIPTLTARAGSTFDDQQLGQLVPAHPHVAFTVRAGGGGSGHNTTVVPLGRQRVTHALTAEGHDASEDGTGRGTPLIVFDWKTDGTERTRPNLSTHHTSTIQTGKQDAVADGTAVRRLTPLECERLQGFPDQWTATSNGRPQADSPRYRQLGNSVAVPVVQWIAHRIVTTDQANTP